MVRQAIINDRLIPFIRNNHKRWRRSIIIPGYSWLPTGGWKSCNCGACHNNLSNHARNPHEYIQDPRISFEHLPNINYDQQLQYENRTATFSTPLDIVINHLQHFMRFKANIRAVVRWTPFMKALNLLTFSRLNSSSSLSHSFTWWNAV